MLTFLLKCPNVNICITGGADITSVSSACLAVYLHFKYLSSWIAFFDKYLEGEIKQAFNPLQKELRKQRGLENVELEVIVFEEDFQRSVKTIGTRYITKSIHIISICVCARQLVCARERACMRACMRVYALKPLEHSLGMKSVPNILIMHNKAST